MVAFLQVVARTLESVVGKELQYRGCTRHPLIEKRATIGCEITGLVFDQRATGRKIGLMKLLVERRASRHIVPAEAAWLGKKRSRPMKFGAARFGNDVDVAALTQGRGRVEAGSFDLHILN